MTKRGCPGKHCCLWDWRELMEKENHEEGGEVYQKFLRMGMAGSNRLGRRHAGVVAWELRKLLRMVRVQLSI